MSRIVTFLSDYGHRDEFVGVVHGVIAQTAADVRVIDLTHGIPGQDVRAGALALTRALPFTPAGVRLAPGDVVRVATDALREQVRCVCAFTDVDEGELLVYDDAAGALALAVNRGDASARLGLSPGDELRLETR